ncbi:MAG: hypothetical protein NTU98_07640 [Bacteroidetes bacterium]|nr:hypothetical protein [Bacteroidota bacterium]
MSKQQHPVDDLFRRELADYRVTPAQERRAELLGDAGREINRGPWPRLWIVGTIAAILIIGGIITGILVSSNQEHRVTGNQKTEARKELNKTINETHKPVQNVVVAGGSASPSLQQIAQSTKTKSNPAENENAFKGNAILNRKPEEKKITDRNDIKENVKPTIVQPEKPVIVSPAPAETKVLAAAVPVKPTEQAKTEIIPPQAKPEEPLQKAEVKQPPEQNAITQDQPKENKITHKEKYHQPKQWNIDMGVYYTPEWMFNTLNGDKFVNNTGVEGTFHFGPFSVRTGLGLSITVGYNEVLVKTNPYLGTYKSLDSISFSWDGNYNLVPSYYTTSKEVFDTALQYNYTNYKKRYTYLQVPLILGYDFWRNRWLSLGVRGGAVMSVLLNTETLSGGYDPGKDKIVMINNVTPDRIQLNWQAVAGMNASFRLSRRFSVELEPDLRYYFNSVYQSSDMTKKIWSVGVRSALLITL